jgi:hypothetical protein
MKKFDSHKWIKDFKMNSLLTEADVFSGDAPTDDAEESGATSNKAIKKFELLIKEKAPWGKVRELVPDLPDLKQVEFAMALLTDLQLGDTARKKLKLKL